MTNIKDFKEAISYNRRIIKIFLIAKKDTIFEIRKFNQISFLWAGKIALNEINKFKSIVYRGVVVRSKGYDDEKFDPEIFKNLNCRMKNT